MLRISCLPSSTAALHNISRVSLIFTTVLLVRNSEKCFTAELRYSLHI